VEITFNNLGGVFKTYTAIDRDGNTVATIRWQKLPNGNRWGVHSRKLNGWRFFETVAEAKAEIIKLEETTP